MQEFNVNEFISLKLDGGSTQIIVNGKDFIHCKYLIITIPTDRIDKWEGYDSMDEIIKATGRGEGDRKAAKLTPQEAFWGHCSNLQAWTENGYDYRLLDTKLSIPIIMKIMKRLVKTKDKEKFRKFFIEVVKSLDDYIINSVQNEATYQKFNFLNKILFRIRDKYFTDEEITGSIALKTIYDKFLPRKLKERTHQQMSRWERKIWERTPVVELEHRYYVGDKEFHYKESAEAHSKKENLEYRRFLRAIRSTSDFVRNKTVVSDEIDYLPYLYAKGKFINAGHISLLNLKNDKLIIRDEKGNYWLDDEYWDRGYDYGYRGYY